MKKLLIAGVLATALAFTVRHRPRSCRACTTRTTRVRQGDVHQEDEDLAPREELPDGHERGRRRRGHRCEWPDVPVGAFTLASATQCQGGSPRFNVDTTTGFFFLGCNNVTPTTNANGTVTYTFTSATLAAAGQQVPTPTGTIESVSVLIDVQGTADLTKVMFNGKLQKLAPGKADFARPCKKGGWKTFSSPAFKNQGQCVKYLVHGRNAANKSA